MEPSTEQETCWRLCAPDAYSWRVWDGESVLYDERTGATHLLGAGPTMLLQLLGASGDALTTKALAERAFEVHQALDPRDRTIVEAALVSLARLGLIEQSPD